MFISTCTQSTFTGGSFIAHEPAKDTSLASLFTDEESRASGSLSEPSLVAGERADVWGERLGLLRAHGAHARVPLGRAGYHLCGGWGTALTSGLCSLGIWTCAFWTSGATLLTPYCHSCPNPPTSHRSWALEGGAGGGAGG